MKIGVIDYGVGNLRSIQKAFECLGVKAIISSDLEQLIGCDKLVLPGVGAFAHCKEQLDSSFDDVTALISTKPTLGICVGMQLLALDSEENGNHKGLGWIKGHIKKLPSQNLKMPHMGWNSIQLKNPELKIKPPKADYYFVHSYYFKCVNKEDILAETVYGINFTSIVAKENIYGVQFHPEKSSNQGLEIIKQFIEI